MIRLLPFMIAALLLGACGDDDDSSGGSGSGADGDADVDSDADADSDTDEVKWGECGPPQLA